jgi:hypothetical protein
MADEHGPYMDATNPDSEFEIRTGVIRITPGALHSQGYVDGEGGGDSTTPFYMNTGLYLHANSGHISSGVLPEVLIEKASGRIRVQTDGAINGAPIVTGDETAAANRLMFGASGGNDYINITCSDENGPVNLATTSGYDSIASGNLNLWIAWLSPKVRGTTGGVPRLDALEARIAKLEGTP